MTFEQDGGPSVPQETAPGSLDDDYRPQDGRSDADMLGRGGQTLPV